MILFEFLSRIAFFSVLTWSFFLIAVLCAIVLTNLSSPLIRRYRSMLIALCISSIFLGMLSWGTPFFLSRWNPNQSRLTPIDELVNTEWIEPVSNPATELPPDEIGWTKELPYQFKYKIKLAYELKNAIVVEGNEMVVLDTDGNVHGFNAYTGLNHWSIPVRAISIMGQLVVQKKLYLLDRNLLGALRVSCFDLVNPSLLWQRMVPGSKEGAISFDAESQNIIVSAGTNGIWALRGKTGEVLWKRPEIYSKNPVIPSPKHLLVFEPVVAAKSGSWYFLDAQTGATLQKTPHLYGEIQSFLPFDFSAGPPLTFMARVDAENYIHLNHTDLSQVWSFHASERVKLARYVDKERFFVLYESNLLELRNLKDNSLIYQKKLTGTESIWFKLSPDKEWFALTSIGSEESAGVSFFKVATGDYQVTARTSEPILDLQFFGDWVYLFSENYIWALKK